MKNNHRFFTNKNQFMRCLLPLLIFFTHAAIAQNVNVSGALSGNGTYPDLNAAFSAINASSQTAATITVDIVANTTETVAATLNAGTWSALLVRPQGGNYTVSGSLPTPLVDFDNASGVRIDGLNAGGNSLTFQNNDAGNILTTTIRFINGASNNTITNCRIEGASTSATLGTVTFSTSSGLGNNNNVVLFCNIAPAGGSTPVNALYSAGTSTAENSNNTIQSCNLFDYFNPAVAGAGVVLAANNNSWTVSNCRFYQTTTRTYTVATTQRAIYISSGSSHTISGNIIGYASSSSTGTTVMGATVALRYVAIELALAATNITSIQGNTVSAITVSTSSGANTVFGILCGVYVTAGNVNVGNIVGNVFGGVTGTDLLQGFPTTTGGMIVGISSATTGSVLVQGNTFGGFSSTGSAASIGGGVAGINVSAVSVSMRIINNTIGNNTPFNMRAGVMGTTTGASLGSGMNLSSTPTGTTIITGNTIRNFVTYGTGSSYVRGIWTAASSGAAPSYSIVSNSIDNLISNSGLTTLTNGQAGALGINISTGSLNVVSNNTISNIALTGTNTNTGYAAGITIGNATSPLVSANIIYNISNASTNTVVTAPGIASGIVIRSATNDVTIVNNMISLGAGVSDDCSLIGIMGNHGSSPNPIVNIFYNTINISGTVTTGANPSFGIHRGDLTTASRTMTYNILNNLINNTRTGGTGAHYAIGNNYNSATSSATGWAANGSNNNVLNANAATIGHWTTAQTFSGWKTASASDAASYSGIPVTFVNPISDLHLNMGTTPTFIESGAQVVSAFTVDIDNQNRPGPVGSVNGGGLTPDIGADEFDGSVVTCTTAAGGVIPVTSGSACAGQTMAVVSNSATSGVGMTYQWQVGTAAGGPYSNVTGGSGATTTSYTSDPLPAGVFYVVLRATCNGTIIGFSNEATLTVNAVPSASAATSTSVICSGNNVVLAGSSNIGTTYQWTGPNGFTASVQNPTVAAASVFASGVYTLNTVASACTSTASTVSVTVNATPNAITVTPTNASICLGDSTLFTATGGKIPAVFNFTPQTNQNTTTTYPAPYSVYYGGQKMQFIVLASELTAAGISPGNITAIQFPVVSFGSNWGSSMTSLQSFQISIGATSSGAVTGTFFTGLSVVLNAANYTPVVGYNNLHVFNTPFVWDGVSNLVVETVFSNNITGTTSDAVIQYNSPTSFQSTMVYRADGVTFATMAAATTTNVATSLVRPDFKLHGEQSPPLSWLPVTGLSSATNSTVNASPASLTAYTVSSTNAGCSVNNSATVSVTQPPVITISNSNSVICSGETVTLVASGAPTFSWDAQNTTATLVVTPNINTVYTVSTSVLPCALVTESTSITVNALPQLTVTPNSASACVNSSVTFTATGAANYTWTGGSQNNTLSAIAITNTILTVSGTSTDGCVASTQFSLDASPLPTISVAAGNTSVCAGTAVSFTANGASTYSWNTGIQNSVLTVTPGSNTGYTVTGILATGCFSTSSVNATVFNLPAVAISLLNDTICEGETLVLTASGAANYVWSGTTGNSSSVSVTPIIGTNGYTVTGSDANNCSKSASVSVVVDLCTAISKEKILDQVSVYPVPSSGIVNVSLQQGTIANVRILDNNGKMIFQNNSVVSTQQFDLSAYSKGIYVISVTTADKTANFRIIIE